MKVITITEPKYPLEDYLRDFPNVEKIYDSNGILLWKKKFDLKQFLSTQSNSFYAFVTYDGKTEPTYFCLYNFDNEHWFLESSCELRFYGKKAVVENFQIAPYLWKYEIESIEIVSEKEVLRYLLAEKTLKT